MNTRVLSTPKTWVSGIDWRLLIFLLLVLDVKLWVKVLAVVLAFAFQPDFHFGFRFRSPGRSRLPAFYFLMAGIAILDWLLHHQFALAQDTLLAGGLFFWVMSILIVHQTKLFAERIEPASLHRTLTVFFLLNNVVSFATLIGIMIKTGTINPYSYLGMDQTYFISTGDFIRGVSFDFSTTNALLCTLGLVYFLRRNQTAMTIFTMATILLTGSNFTNILVFLILVFCLFYRSDRRMKLTVAACLVLMGFFMVVVSPENKEYAKVTLAKIAGEDTFVSQKDIIQAAKPDTSVPVPKAQVELNQKAASIDTMYKFQPTPRQSRLPGKVISFQETLRFLMARPLDIPFGAGAGHFSSKLAFRASKLGTEGGWPARVAYIDSNFLHNHLSLFLYYFTKGNQHHSIIHTPYSVYNQALGEYGIAGLAALLIFYFYYFLSKGGKQVANWMLLAVIAAAFFTDYWFEQLSIVVLFELLFFVNIREGSPPGNTKPLKE